MTDCFLRTHAETESDPFGGRFLAATVGPHPRLRVSGGERAWRPVAQARGVALMTRSRGGRDGSGLSLRRRLRSGRIAYCDRSLPSIAVCASALHRASTAGC